MFSPRFLAVLALLATVAALPATDKPGVVLLSKGPSLRPISTITEDDPFMVEDTPWFSFPSLGNLFAPLWRLLPSFGELGPRIVADDKEFKVIVNVKDYKKDDLKVKVKGSFIFVSGSHEAKEKDRDIFASQFFHTYSLPANASGEDVNANLTSDGYLVVTAPVRDAPVEKDSKAPERIVPIVETGAPLPKEEKKDKTTTTTKEETTTTAETATVTANATETEDDRKEPTTPSNRDLMDKENNIPHGNNDIL